MEKGIKLMIGLNDVYYFGFFNLWDLSHPVAYWLANIAGVSQSVCRQSNGKQSTGEWKASLTPPGVVNDGCGP